MIIKGQFVKILPKWCDDPEEETMLFLVVQGEEKGYPKIVIEFPVDMDIKPTQLIETYMVKTVE